MLLGRHARLLRGPTFARRTAAALAVLALAACGSTPPGGPDSAASALRARLEALDLSVRSVACIGSGLVFNGATAFRCTVNFGDPHLVPYCAVLVDGELVTDRERPELRCYPPEDEVRYRAATAVGSADG